MKLLQWVGFNPTDSEFQEWCQEFDKNRTGQISLPKVKVICNRKQVDPESIEQTIEALKLFDHSKDGKIDITELRWAMTKLGDCLDEKDVDEMITLLDPEKSGQIDIMAHAKYTHNIKEEKEEKKGKKDGGGGKKK